MGSTEGDLSISVEWPEGGAASGSVRSEVEASYRNLLKKSVPGSDSLGWLEWPRQVEAELVERINELADEIQEEAELFVSTGIGGSYLGGRAVVEALRPFDQLTDYRPEIGWAGNQLSGNYHERLLAAVEQKSTFVNVISKSGTTTETALAFRLLRRKLENKYSAEECRKRIIVTTSRDSGALAGAAEEKGYRKFVIPENIGGRFSVFTPVGLVPVAAAGLSIKDLLQGASEMARKLSDSKTGASSALRYATVRNAFYRQGGKLELFSSFYPELSYVADWWQQLFGESEGKDGEGLYPATADFTTDLHSLGQYIQDGPNQLLETIPVIKQQPGELEVPKTEANSDELNYLAGRSFSEVNREALVGTRNAHLDGGIPVVSLEIPQLNAYWLGGLLYFFQFSCALSALTLGVNPFNQPGVEAYKSNMYKRLGKPGYE